MATGCAFDELWLLLARTVSKRSASWLALSFPVGHSQVGTSAAVSILRASFTVFFLSTKGIHHIEVMQEEASGLETSRLSASLIAAGLGNGKIIR